MKKGVLILLGIFMMVSSVEAKNGNKLPNRFRVDYYTYNKAVNFFERGIEFFVFTNGDFDFNTNFNNRNLRINRDNRGKIRRIGNVSLRYDFRGNVTRIGNIRINYFRNKLSNVGDLRVRYDRWGEPLFYGNVRNFYVDNGIRFNVNYGDVFVYNDPFFLRNDFRTNYTQFREDRNFFYYKTRPNAIIGNRSTILKRRKQANINRNNNSVSRRNSNSTYRKSNTNRRISSDKNTKKRTDVRRYLNLKNRQVDTNRNSVNIFTKNRETKRKETTNSSSEVKKNSSKIDRKRKG